MLGRYELLLPIAAGGMAMVWAARVKGTRGFQKIVAVKTMLSNLTEDEQFEKMFLDEASLASQIRHPNVVEISDLGEQEGVLYLAMEWIDGVPLNQLMKASKAAGGIPLPVAVRIVMNACAGLHAAHELKDSKGRLVGLVHRDISPQNILVTYDGVSKVVDFGVAKATAMGGGATVAGQLKGKVSYMAPEQVRGEPIDRRIDVFAMGIVLYALTTGKHPFRRESEAATMYTIASDEPVVSPRKFLPDYPVSLETVLLKALAKDAKLRYSTAFELQRALDQALPAAERANTDQDVGAFVGKIFGAKREESRAALAHALELADKQGPRTAGSAPNPLSQSQVSSVSTVGVAATLMPESTFTSVGAPPSLDRRKRRALLFGIAGTLLAVGSVAIALSRGHAADTSRPAAQLPTASALPIPAPSEEPHATDLQALPLESAAPPDAPAASASARIPRAVGNLAARPPASAGASTAAPASSSAKAAAHAAPPKWRHDPGF